MQCARRSQAAACSFCGSQEPPSAQKKPAAQPSSELHDVGQAAPAPSHESGKAHAVPAGCTRSAGQLGAVPVQLSATSHAPAEARQTTVGGR
jgi:hypothetical protein